MASVNKVILLGRVGRDAELKYTQSGQAVCNFSLATSEKWKSKDGEAQEKTEWSKIVCWGKTAELCGEYVHKGDLIYVEGRLETREWEKDGQKRQTTEINAHVVQFLGGKGEKKEEAPSNQGGCEESGGGYQPPTEDDDIPF